MNKQPFLQVEQLKKTYGEIRAVNGISFFVEKGEAVGIVGESGCGKSTTARLIAGLEKPTGGRVLLQGEPRRLRSGRYKKCHVNMIFQDPRDSFDSHMTVFSSLYEALSHTRRTERRQARLVIEELLTQVELSTEYADRRIAQLSGGECQRIAIARALLTEPELLICDEATSALDVSIQKQILELLKRIRKERQLTFLVISHDLALVSHLCSRVLVMYQGKIVEEGDVKKVLRNPEHPYTKLLLASGAAFMPDPYFYNHSK